MFSGPICSVLIHQALDGRVEIACRRRHPQAAELLLQAHEPGLTLIATEPRVSQITLEEPGVDDPCPIGVRLTGMKYMFESMRMT